MAFVDPLRANWNHTVLYTVCIHQWIRRLAFSLHTQFRVRGVFVHGGLGFDNRNALTHAKNTHCHLVNIITCNLLNVYKLAVDFGKSSYRLKVSLVNQESPLICFYILGLVNSGVNELV